MSRSCHVLLAVGGLLACLSLSSPPPARGQGNTADPEAVRFDSTDQVQLRGTFYPTPQGRKAPCVLLIHAPGQGNDHRTWDSLARSLQSDGLAVLAFDLRGHGGSTAVGGAFWQVPENRQLVHGFHSKRPSEAIDLTDYSGAYYPMLANDVAAARGFLDRKNDARECNASQLIIIAAGEGATLGALWLASESVRHRALGGITLRLEPTPAIEDAVCAVWLSLSPSLGKREVPVLDWLRAAGRDQKFPMGFLHGDGDRDSEAFDDRCVAAVKSRDDGAGLTAARGVKGSKAAGMALLDTSLETTELIRRYIGNIRKDQAAKAWEVRDFNDQAYFWSWPNSTPLVAKLPGEGQTRLLPLRSLGIR